MATVMKRPVLSIVGFAVFAICGAMSVVFAPKLIAGGGCSSGNCTYWSGSIGTSGKCSGPLQGSSDCSCQVNGVGQTQSACDC